MGISVPKPSAQAKQTAKKLEEAAAKMREDAQASYAEGDWVGGGLKSEAAENVEGSAAAWRTLGNVLDWFGY